MQAQTCDSGTELFGFAASFLPKHILFPLVGLHPAAARHFSRLAKKKKKRTPVWREVKEQEGRVSLWALNHYQVTKEASTLCQYT